MKLKLAKVALFLAALLPLGHLGWKAYNGMLGANPIEVLTHSTGDWTLIFLTLTIAITPLRRLTAQHCLIRFRRMLGLFAFFYACLHFTTYIWLDKFFDVHDMVKDIGKRPFITLGFTAFVLLIPLAITSTQRMIRRLGRRWGTLHRLIYISAVAGIVHYWWSVKADIRKPEYYAAAITVLLGFRVFLAFRKKSAARLAPARHPEEVAAD